VQTFCPVDVVSDIPSFIDDKRLGKQIIESQQIFKSLTFAGYGWKSHPATKMWDGSRGALVEYTKFFNDEWVVRRGKSHGGWLNLVKIVESVVVPAVEFALPSWWGRHDVHDSHKSNLVRKLPEHYSVFWPEVGPDLPYVWPVR
jgi:hypothetical protein